MAIPVTCAGCGRKFSAQDEFAGKTGRCPGCGQPLVVPSTGSVDELSKSFAELEAWDVYTRPVRHYGRLIWLVGGITVALVLVVALVLLLTARGPTAPPVKPPTADAGAGPVRPAAPARPTAGPERPQATPQRPLPPPVRQPVAAPAAATPPPVIVEAGQPQPEEDLRGVAADTKAAAAHTGSARWSGHLEGRLAVQLDAIVAAYVRQTVQAERGGVRVLDVGGRVDVTLDGRRYQGRIYRASTVFILPERKLDTKEFHVLTTAPWQLTDNDYVPVNTCISYKGGRYELVDLDVMKAEAAKRDVFVRKALAETDARAKQKDWAGAKEVLTEALKVYPEAFALTKRMARLEREPYYVLVSAVNREPEGVEIRLDQAGATVLDVTLPARKTLRFEVRRGDYNALWIGIHRVSSERISIQRPERWTFMLGQTVDVAGMGSSPIWQRFVQAADAVEQ